MRQAQTKGRNGKMMAMTQKMKTNAPEDFIHYSSQSASRIHQIPIRYDCIWFKKWYLTVQNSWRNQGPCEPLFIKVTLVGLISRSGRSKEHWTKKPKTWNRSQSFFRFIISFWKVYKCVKFRTETTKTAKISLTWPLSAFRFRVPSWWWPGSSWPWWKYHFTVRPVWFLLCRSWEGTGRTDWAHWWRWCKCTLWGVCQSQYLQEHRPLKDVFHKEPVNGITASEDEDSEELPIANEAEADVCQWFDKDD